MRAATTIAPAAFGIGLLTVGLLFLPAAEKEIKAEKEAKVAKETRTDQQDKAFAVRPIGRVRVADGRATVELDKAYQPALSGLEGWSHIHVVWWFDKNDTPQQRAILQVHPRGDQTKPLTGVFATRSPVRPNLIAMTVCKVVSVKENVIEIDKIDAFDGTPVLDIKPYIPADSVPNVKVPAWAGARQ